MYPHLAGQPSGIKHPYSHLVKTASALTSTRTFYSPNCTVLCLTISQCVHMGIKATQQLCEIKKAVLRVRLTFVAGVALITWESRITFLVGCARLSRSSGATRRRKFQWRTSSRRRWLPGTSASTLSLGLLAATSVWGWRSLAVLYQVTDLLRHNFSGFE